MFKVTNRLHLLQVIGALFLSSIYTYAQTTVDKEYAVPVIKSLKAYQKTITADNDQQMADLVEIIPLLQLDLRYAGKNNFMHKSLYPPVKTTYLRLPVARALLNVQMELSKKQLALKIFDAYRPYSVTKEMWKLIHDERYVADPHKGSGHNRGIAVDLTIIDINTQKELDMGTGFDNFTDSAHHAFNQFPENVLQNRKLLKEIMEGNGY
jgi:D-alanyl-D-alanine dipeptidase